MAGPHHFQRRREDVRQVRQPCRCVELHDEHVVVSIQHQAWHPVVLAVYQAIAVRVSSREIASHQGCGSDALFEPRHIDRRRRVVLQDAYSQWRCRVIQPDGQESIVAVEDHGEIPGDSLSPLLLDRAVEQPGMAFAQVVLRDRRDMQRESAAARRRDPCQALFEMHVHSSIAPTRTSRILTGRTKPRISRIVRGPS